MSFSRIAVPAIILSELFPVIPKFSFINMLSLVDDENKQNYSIFGYIGGGFDKKSMYSVGRV